MAGSFTFADLKTKIENDLDLVEETFITQEELLGYVNEGIRRAEQEILTVYQDYFLDKQALPLVSGTAEYALPTDIYAHKIRKIMYSNGADIYPIRYLHSKSYKFEDFTLTNAYPGAQRYRYEIINNVTTGKRIVLYPPSRETSSTNVIIWYIRDAYIVTAIDDTTAIDIPEAFNFIYAYVKMKCVNKENGGIAVTQAQEEFLDEKKMLIESLTNAVVDDDNVMEQDLTHYYESE